MDQGDISKYYKYNDYELIFYARQHSDEALELLIEKYSKFIRSKISKLKVPSEYYDDFYQEGLMALTIAVNTFDESIGAPFTNFFDTVLKRHLISVMRKEFKNFQLEKKEDLDEYLIVYPEEHNEMLLKEEDYNFSDLEKIVYENIIIKGLSPSTVAKEYNINPKALYNGKRRVLLKIKGIRK